MPRRFKPPWTAKRIPGDCVVKDATGQVPAYARETQADTDTKATEAAATQIDGAH